MQLNRRALLGALLTLPLASLGADADLAALAYQVLAGRRAPKLDDFLTKWPDPTGHRPIIPSSVPVLRYLHLARQQSADFGVAFVATLVRSAAHLAWRRSYSTETTSAEFQDNYGWTELVGLSGPLPSEHLACGVLLLGPHTRYPAHHHEAEEIYVPLSGTAEWLQPDGHFVSRAPGSVIYHASNQVHAMRTGADPLLALYAWRSANLNQSSQLDEVTTHRVVTP